MQIITYWSNLAVHFLQTRQCFERNGFRAYYNLERRVSEGGELVVMTEAHHAINTECLTVKAALARQFFYNLFNMEIKLV